MKRRLEQLLIRATPYETHTAYLYTDKNYPLVKTVSDWIVRLGQLMGPIGFKGLDQEDLHAFNALDKYIRGRQSV